MTELAIIIVNWNVSELLAGCLHSVVADLATSPLSAEIWVVDNASSDGSVEMIRREFPQVNLIASDQNLGFAKGNNTALRAIGFDASDSLPPGHAADECQVDDLPEAVLLLNPDTEVHPGALQILFDFFNRTPSAGVAGAQLVYGDGSFQHSAFGIPGLWQLAIELLPLPGRLVESRLNGRYPRKLYERGQPFRIGHPLGAAMCVRQEAIHQVGLLDERFRMYVEEVDWGKRIVAAGWEAYCVPRALITHFGGQSSGQIKRDSFINLWTSRRQFYIKHYSPFKVWFARQIVRLGMRRKAKQDSKAVKQGYLTQAELAERLLCYQSVTNVWQGNRQ